MSRRMRSMHRCAWPVMAAAWLLSSMVPDTAQAQGAGQKIDEEYTAKIKEYLRDPRITTELVDHLPASQHRADARSSSSGGSSGRRAS